MKAIVYALVSPLAVMSAAPAASAQDVADGERLFRQRCAACHSTTEGRNLPGPHLAGVVGRDVASVDGARYSDGLKSMGGAWDPSRLSAFISDPRSAAPGTRMTVSVRDEGDREDILAYLETLTPSE